MNLLKSILLLLAIFTMTFATNSTATGGLRGGVSDVNKDDVKAYVSCTTRSHCPRYQFCDHSISRCKSFSVPPKPQITVFRTSSSLPEWDVLEVEIKNEQIFLPNFLNIQQSSVLAKH
jgi:hypothetical protein